MTNAEPKLEISSEGSIETDSAHSLATPQRKETRHDFNEQTNYVPVRQIITIFIACASVDLLALLDQTTLAGSLPIVARQLHASSQSAWLAGAYFLTSTCFQLLYGRLSDIWSRKLILMAGIVIFFVGSLGASLSQTMVQLIVFRAITGVGGGGLGTVAQLIVSDIVSLRERGKYQGILGSVTALANAIGPIIGGALTSQGEGSWRWIFRLNLPMTVLTTVCVVFFMPLRPVIGDWKVKLAAIDFIGAALALGGSTVLVLGLIWAGGEYPWGSAHVITTLVLGFLITVAFVLWQWKGTSKPLIPMHIFRIKLVDGVFMTTFINGWNLLVQVYYLPSFYQLVYGYSAVKAAALLLPITLVQTLASTASGWIIHKTGRYRELLLSGWAFWTLGLGLFCTLTPSSGLGKQIGFSVLTGLGVGQTLQPSLIAVQAGVDRRHMAVVTSVRSFVRNLGGTLGLAISGTLINNIFASALGISSTSPEIQQLRNTPEEYLASIEDPDEAGIIQQRLVDAYRKGFRTIFIIMTALAATGLVLAWWTVPHVPLDREDDEALREEGRRREKTEENRGDAPSE